jgi:hypothetical protein
MDDRPVPGADPSAPLALKGLTGLLTAFCALAAVFGGWGILLSLFRIVWYPSAHPWLVVAIYILALLIGIWGFRHGRRTWRNPSWSRIGILALAAMAVTAAMIGGKYLGEARRRSEVAPAPQKVVVNAGQLDHRAVVLAQPARG